MGHNTVGYIKSYNQASVQVFTFGKHRGKTIHEVWLEDDKYLKWIVGQTWLGSTLRQAINIYLDEREKVV